MEDLAAEDEAQAMPLVGDYCGSWGTDFKKVEAIGLVTNLNNTGSDPPPSQARESLFVVATLLAQRAVKKAGQARGTTYRPAQSNAPAAKNAGSAAVDAVPAVVDAPAT